MQNFTFNSQSWSYKAFKVLLSRNKEKLNGLDKDMLDGQILIVGNFRKPKPGEHSKPKLFESEVFINQYYKNTDEVFQHSVANEILKGLTSNGIKIWNELGGKFPGEKRFIPSLYFYMEKKEDHCLGQQKNMVTSRLYTRSYCLAQASRAT